METQQRHIRFDWAIKRLLRNKANYKVLEGFLSELLREDVKIISIGDSEGNQDYPENKFNRVDVLVENDKKELFIIELQNSSEADYLLRMLYGVSRVITNHINLGDDYRKVRKVYSVNIVYFEIGQGTDYVYHGRNEFRGIHHQDILKLSKKQESFFGYADISRVFPEYYIIKVNDFNDVAKDSLDEWIYFLKNDRIPDNFKAKGLPEARKALRFDKLSQKEQEQYRRYVDQVLFERNAIQDAKEKGLAEGKAEGLAEGKAEREKLERELEKEREQRLKEKKEAVLKSFRANLSIATISDITGLPEDEIQQIIKSEK
ncbi:MAG: Rpn family recombination-promoting nuclease/putative transposase [Tannerellaceae bacterium]|jgi:predicted transposase/invertase (TIGR01784 family)|nr:Rpn family recombination-promoting nuclease/putative transposase [Tannerellaceae bacterium]